MVIRSNYCQRNLWESVPVDTSCYLLLQMSNDKSCNCLGCDGNIIWKCLFCFLIVILSLWVSCPPLDLLQSLDSIVVLTRKISNAAESIVFCCSSCVFHCLLLWWFCLVYPLCSSQITLLSIL